MEIELKDRFVHVEKSEAGLQVATVIDPTDEDVCDAVGRLMADHSIHAVVLSFPLSEVLASVVELHMMPAYGHAIDVKAKPLVDALRAELMAMVEKIDGLTFADPEARCEPA